jgi:cation transport ATPase
MAMSYLHFGETARIGAGLLALGLMPVIALQLRRPALELARVREHIEGPGSRTRFVFRVITLPALLATALVIPFRVPRELIEVLVVPLLVLLSGVPWIQAGAWRVCEARANGTATVPSLAYLFAAVLGLLLIFQLVLRPGIRFY